MSNWTIAEIIDEPKAETRSTRAEVLDAIRDIVHRRTGVDLTGEVGVRLDPNTEEVLISLCGVTLSDDGDIIAGEREYEFTGTVFIEVEVTGTITAKDEDEARDAINIALSEVGFDIEARDWSDLGIEVQDWTANDAHIDDVSEA